MQDVFKYYWYEVTDGGDRYFVQATSSRHAKEIKGFEYCPGYTAGRVSKKYVDRLRKERRCGDHFQ